MARNPLPLLLTLAFATASPASAQVDKVAIRTDGVSCGTCAAVSEVQLRRLAIVDNVIISLSKEAIMVSFKPNTRLQLQPIRDILRPLNVAILQIQVSARGILQAQGSSRIFVAGKDRFSLVDSATPLKIPTATPIVVEGVLNDRVDPMQLKVMTFKPVAR